MKIRKQKHKLTIGNFDCLTRRGAGVTLGRHSPLLPNTIWCIICGGSGCGKTNVVLGLLFDPDGLRYDNIYVYSKSLYQPKYQMLATLMNRIPQIGYFPFSESDKVVSPEEVRTHSIMIFDDVIKEEQDIVAEYFSIGRNKYKIVFTCRNLTSKHPGVWSVTTATSLWYSGSPVRHIYDDHVRNDMSFEEFNEICSKAWTNDKYGFLGIDKERDLNDGRYRIGFNRFISDIGER